MILSLVTDRLLYENNISRQDVLSILSDVSNNKIDFSDFYFQSIIHESWMLEENIIKEGTFYSNEGIGVRVVSGESTSFAYANSITLNSLINSVTAVSNIFSSKFKTNISKQLIDIKAKPLYSYQNPFLSINTKEKIEILQRINIIARKTDHRVVNVNATLSSVYDQMLLVTTDGSLAADIRPLVSLSISVLVIEKGKSERGVSGISNRSGYSFFLRKHQSGVTLAEYYATEAVRLALINLSAKEAPSGTFPVVLGPGWPGILLHEAVGHGLEGDFNRQGTSMFSNKIGQKVASELCTIVDDGTIENNRGSLTLDDEGIPGQYNVLIENGILKKYLQDKFNANLTQTKSTGNGRRESYAHLPLPRMTNTYMLPGSSLPEDIISSVDFGIYALNFSGGQVDITSGKFVFSTSEAYLINDGKVTTSIKNAMLIGSGFSSMNEVSMVGNDLLVDGSLGTCIKNGQSVPVGVGQPTIKLNNLTVGGTL